MSIDLNKPYNPGIADIGKYAEVVAPSVSSYGHYAVLTVNAGTLPASAGGLGGPLGTQEDPIWTNFTTVVSAVEVSLSGFQMSEVISAVNCVVSTLDVNPLTSIEVSNIVTIAPVAYNVIQASALTVDTVGTSAVFSPAVRLLDIANNSNDTIYFWLDEASTIPGGVLSAIGMPLELGSYYSTTGLISCVTVVSEGSASNVRIIGRGV